MPHYLYEKNDVGLLRQDGTTNVGLMLRKEKDQKGNDVPVYRTVYDNYLVNQYTTSPDFGATNPIQELHIAGASWRGGFGQYIEDSTQAERYLSSIGCDLSDKDQATAGWNSSTITIPAATVGADVTDPGFEAWTGGVLDSYTLSAGSMTQDTSTQLAGASSPVLYNVATLYQDIAATNYKGRRFTFTALCKTATASNAKIRIWDGLTWSESSFHGGGGGNETLTVTKVFSPAATAFRIQFQQYVGANQVRFDTVTLTGGGGVGAIASHATFNSKEYIGCGAVLAKMNAGGTEFESQYEFAASITALVPYQVSGTDYLFIFLGTSTSYEYMTTAQAFTTSNATYKTFQFGAWVNTTVDTMYANDGNNTIRSTVNPLNGGTEWSNPQTFVGEASNAMTGLLEKSGALYIMKTDMPYYLDSTGAVKKDLAPELKSAKASTSGKNSHIWKNSIYIPAGDQALLEVGTVNTFRNPSDYCTNLSDFVGRVFAVASDEKWLFVAVDNSTKVEILKGRQETIGSTTSWVWHPFHELTLTGVETMWVSTVVAKRLYISSTTASESLYYLPLPTQYGNITSDSAATFKDGTYFITPYYHGGFKGIPKTFPEITADLGHTFSASTYYECHYQGLAAGTTWVDMGDLKGSSTSMTATLYNSTPPVSTMFRFKFVAKTASTAVTPVLVNFDAKMIVRPTARNLIYCEVEAKDAMFDKNGVRQDGVNAAYIRTVIDEAQDAKAPFTFYDYWGNTKYVIIMPIDPFFVPTRDTKGEEVEGYYRLLLQEVALS